METLAGIDDAFEKGTRSRIAHATSERYAGHVRRRIRARRINRDEPVNKMKRRRVISQLFPSQREPRVLHAKRVKTGKNHRDETGTFLFSFLRDSCFYIFPVSL